jgi:hypothetical protein
MKLKERSKMKRLIAIVLGIALLSPTPANANGSTYQLLTPVLTTTYELPAQDRNSRWDTIKIPFSVVLTSDGTVASFAFVLIDAEGFELSTRYFNAFNAYFSPQTWTQNDEWKLYQHDKAKLPIRLKTEIRFWSSTAKPTITQTFPMNFAIHKDDLAAKAQADAVAKAQADAVAKAKAEAEAKVKAEAEAKAKAEAELKAKQEAEAKAIAEAEAKAKVEAEAKARAEAEAKAKAEAKTWTCRKDLQDYYFTTYNKTIELMNEAESNIFCNKLINEMNAAKAETIRQEFLKEQEKELRKFIGKPCKTLKKFKENEAGYLQCISKKGKKVWGSLSLYN